MINLPYLTAAAVVAVVAAFVLKIYTLENKNIILENENNMLENENNMLKVKIDDPDYNKQKERDAFNKAETWRAKKVKQI